MAAFRAYAATQQGHLEEITRYGWFLAGRKSVARVDEGAVLAALREWLTEENAHKPTYRDPSWSMILNKLDALVAEQGRVSHEARVAEAFRQFDWEYNRRGDLRIGADGLRRWAEDYVAATENGWKVSRYLAEQEAGS